MKVKLYVNWSDGEILNEKQMESKLKGKASIIAKDDDEFDKVYIKHFILNPKKTIASEFTLSLKRNQNHY